MKKVAIIGAGISGLIAAYSIAKKAEAQVIIIEKGKCYEERMLGNATELVCGEGGAGTVYGGKMCFPPASSGVWERTGFRVEEFDFFCKSCLTPFIHNKKLPENFDTLFSKKSNFFQKNYESIFLKKSEMNQFVLKLLSEVKKCGVNIFTSCEFINYEKTKEGFVIKYKRDEVELIEERVDYIVFASGRLSSERIKKWVGRQSSVIQQNPDLGIRFSVDYKNSGIFKEKGKDIKLKAKLGEIGVRTFCVCSGGSNAVVNLNGIRYYDGHFEDKLTEQVNLGVLARSPYIHGYEGAALYCTYLKKYMNSDLSLKDFVKYSGRLVKDMNLFDDILEAISYFIHMMQEAQVLDENLDKYPVWLPSVDKLNPIVRTNQYFETEFENVYVIGDAVGISRGFIQSMWSAYCAGNRIVEKLGGQVQRERIMA